MKALGMIEVYGYLAAVEALDSALKAANVNLLDVTLVQGGLVTVLVTGEVGAVKAAMDASKTAAEHVGKLISVHVIPRPSKDIEKIIPSHTLNIPYTSDVSCASDISYTSDTSNCICESILPDSNEGEEGITLPTSLEQQPIISTEIAPINEAEAELKTDLESSFIYDKKITPEAMMSMSVDNLRKLAREMKITNMTNKEIRFGTKNELIKSISKFMEQDRT